MRLVAWNCAMGLERKLAAFSSLRPDIAILSEVACPERLRSQLPILEGMPIVWVGNKANKGLGVTMRRSVPNFVMRRPIVRHPPGPNAAPG